MEQNIVLGAGLKPAPTPQVIHDDQYNAEVYQASFSAPDMDILVPTHAHIDLTIKCLNSLYGYTQRPFHLIVLDDSPADDYGMTGRYIREKQKTLTNITYIHSNIPFKSGNRFFNIGLKYCRTEYVVTCMNSMTVEPAWEIVALQIIQNDSQIGTIGFKCLFPNGLVESAGIAFMGHLPTDMGRDEPGYRCNEIREAQAVQWAFALHRKKALVGNLEEDVFNGHVGWDDIDNCMVLKSKGWKILYCGQGAGIHQPRATRGSNSQEAANLNQENAYKFFKRWGLWDTFIGGKNMDVRELLKYETKDQLTQAVTKYQILDALGKQASLEVQVLVNKGLNELGVSPDQYLLEMNPQKNIWLLKPNPKAVSPLATPALQPSEIIKPASDTQPEKGVIEQAVAEVMAK